MKWLGWAVWLAYLLIVGSLARRDSVAFGEVALVASDGTGAALATWAAILVGTLLCYWLPGALWLRRGPSIGDWLTRCFVASVLLHSALLTLLKLAGFSLDRWSLLLSAALLFAAALPRAHVVGYPPHWHAPPILAAALLLGGALAVFFHPKIFVENFSGDGIEHFEFARSLVTHVLPYWDLENGSWGFYDNFFFFAYPSLLSLLNVGAVEAAVRLPALVLLVQICVLLAEFVPKHARGGWTATALASSLAVLAVFHMMYSTWHPFFADIAEPTGTNLVVAFFVLASLHFLMRRSAGWFVVCALLASASHANGLFLVCLSTLVALSLSPDRRELLRMAAILVVAWAAVRALLWLAGPEGTGPDQYSIAALLGDVLRPASPNAIGRKLGWFALSTGGVSLVGAVAFLRRDRECLQLGIIATAYGLIVLLSQRSHPHYTLAASLLMLPVFLRGLAHLSRPLPWRLAHLIAVAVALVLITPLQLPVNLDTAELGERIAFESNDHRERAAVAPVMYAVLPFSRYGVTHHGLVHYGQGGDGVGSRDFVIARRFTPPSGYVVWARERSAHFFARPDAELPKPDLATRRYGRSLPLRLTQLPRPDRLGVVRSGGARGPAQR